MTKNERRLGRALNRMYDTFNVDIFDGALPKIPVKLGVNIRWDDPVDHGLKGIKRQFRGGGATTKMADWGDHLEPVDITINPHAGDLASGMLLHEMAHVAVCQTLSRPEDDIHGPLYTDECHRIDRLQGIERLRNDAVGAWPLNQSDERAMDVIKQRAGHNAGLRRTWEGQS